MANTIIIKNSSTTTAVPGAGALTEAELALNTTDRKIFTKTSGGTVVEISGVKADEVNAFTAGQSGTVVTLTETTTVAVDLALGNNFSLTLTGTATTVGAPTNAVAGQSGSIFVIQDATGGRTLGWNTAWKFATGTVPTLSTAGDAVDRVDYIVKGASEIHAVWTGDYKR